MPSAVYSEGGRVAKRQKLDVDEKKLPSSRIFAPYRTVGLISPTEVGFTSIPLGKTSFQITTSTGRSLHTYDLRRGLNLVFITRPQTPALITATCAWKDVLFAAWGSSRGSGQGVWVFKRGKQSAELEVPDDLDESITQLSVFGSWMVGCCNTRLEVWKADSHEHYATLRSQASAYAGASSDFSGGFSSIPTLLNKILAGKKDGSVELWNIKTGKLLYSIPSPSLKAGAVTAIQPTPALPLVAIAYTDGSLILHDVLLDRRFMKLNTSAHEARITSISFRTDGLGAGEDGRKDGVMATAAAGDGDITLWDLNDGGRIMGVLRNAHQPPSRGQTSHLTGGVNRVEFLTGQPIIVTSGNDNALKSWIFDESPFSPIPRLLHTRSGHAAPVSTLAFLPAEADGADSIGKWLLSAGRDRSLWGWSLRREGQSTELSQGNIRKKAKQLGFAGKKLELDSSTSLEDLKAPEITCMACNLNRDGGMGASAGGGAVWANVSSAKTGDRERPVTGWESMITGHKGDKFARTWFWGRKKAGRWAFETSDGTEVTAVAMSPCGTFALVGSAGGAIDMFNLQSGIRRQRFPAPLTPVQAKKQKLQQLQAASEDSPDTPARTIFAPGRGKHTEAITGLCVDSLNEVVVSSSLDGLLKFWSFRTGILQHQLNWSPMSSITSLRYHRPSDLIALSCDDLSIRVVDIETRKIVRELWGCLGQIKDLCFSNDGRWVVAASMDGVLRVWDLPTGHLIDAMMMQSVVTALAFSPTGEFLATSHADSIGISVWSNRALFKRLPTRHLTEDETAKALLPTDSGEGAEALLAAALEGEESPDADERDDTLGSSTIPQLSASLTTLSLLPRSRWQTMLHLDLIAERNRPISRPKAPEKAPFFLPALDKPKPGSSTISPLNGADGGGADALTITPAERSRISAAQQRGPGASPTAAFSALLRQQSAGGDDERALESLIGHLQALAPAAADVAIRSLSAAAAPAFSEQTAFVAALTARLRRRRDFELVQAWMGLFLRLHGDAASKDTACRRALRAWRAVSGREAARLAALLGYAGGVVAFLRSAR